MQNKIRGWLPWTVTLALAWTTSLAAGCQSGSEASDNSSSDDQSEPEAADAEALDDVVSRIREQFELPALAGLVSSSEQTLAFEVSGVRVRGSLNPIAADDLFHLGSETKMMTATLVALYVQEGLLTWDTTLGAVFPELAATMHPQFAAVTVTQLLQHRAGFTQDRGEEMNAWWMSFYEDTRSLPEQRLEFVTRMTSVAPATEPGVAFAYSNSGYIIVGSILERLTGQAWEQLITTRVFEPLGMTSCGFGNPRGVDDDAPLGHLWVNGAAQVVPPGLGDDNPPILAPAGTVHCGLEDWARFLRMQLAGARGESDFLSAESFVRLRTPFDDINQYALGWTVAERGWAGGTVLTHSGTNTTWYAVVWLAPGIDRFYVAATNAGGPVAEQASDALVAAMLGMW